MKIGAAIENTELATTFFEASPFQGAIVAKATHVKNMKQFDTSYISVLPGGGKTAIVNWCAKVLE